MASASYGAEERRLRFGWTVISWLGVVLTLVGGASILVPWIPLNIGVIEWEFGTISTFFNQIPLLGLGLGMLLAGGLASGYRWQARFAALVFLLLAAAMWAAAALYATDVPQALAAVPKGDVLTAMTKAVAKTTAEAVIYPFFFLWLGIVGFRRSRAARAGRGQ